MRREQDEEKRRNMHATARIGAQQTAVNKRARKRTEGKKMVNLTCVHNKLGTIP